MGTPLQDVYDSFLQKINENLINKEELIFNYLKSALSKSKKTCSHSLIYELTNAYYFDGNFLDTLDQEEIELISLWMLYEHKRRRKEYIEAIEREIGTRDFNNLPDKVRELTELRQSMKDLKDEIKEFSQDFNTYKYS